MAQIAKTSEIARRIQTMPGVGPIKCGRPFWLSRCHMETFKRGRDFAAWLGLCAPDKHSTGGKSQAWACQQNGSIRYAPIVDNTEPWFALRWIVAKGHRTWHLVGPVAGAHSPRKMVGRGTGPTKWRAACGPCWQKGEDYRDKSHSGFGM